MSTTITLTKQQNRPYIDIDKRIPKIALKLIDACTSYRIKGAEYVDNEMWHCKCGFWKLKKNAITNICPRCRKECETGYWDCVINLTSCSRNGTYYFPMGLLDKIEETLKSAGYAVDLRGMPSEPSRSTRTLDLTWTASWDLRAHQLEAKDKAMEQLHRGKGCMIEMGTGSGKCLGKNTNVIMFDGTYKKVQHLVIGDKLMGPDSESRTIQRTTKGHGKLYKITPIKGNAFICNENHILSLKYTKTHNDRKQLPTNEFNMRLKEYLNETKTFKHITKLWRPEEIQFYKSKVQQLILDPYVVGAWLGDGTLTSPTITHTSTDEQLINELKKQTCDLITNFNMVEITKRNTTTINMTNKKGGKNRKNLVWEELKKCVINNEKRIPRKYLINSVGNRRKLLAGLIDTDGYQHAKTVEIITKYNGLAHDILFLVRSLGMNATMTNKVGTIKSINFTGNYKRISISGKLDEIPTKIQRKTSEKRMQIKRTNVTGFKVKQIDDGEYYGFELDGDGLFLLEDFTITHNSGVLLKIIQELKTPTLILVHNHVLLEQWEKNIKEILNYKASLYGGKTHDIGDITVAMVQSVSNNNNFPINAFGLVIVDESHHVSCDQAYKIMMKSNAYYKIGVTATAKREDGNELKFTAALGSIIKISSIKELIKLGILAKPTIRYIQAPQVKQGDTYAEAYKNQITLNTARNKLIAQEALKIVKTGDNVLICVKQIKHGKTLEQMIPGSKFVHGTTKAEDRQKTMNDFKNGKLMVIISTLLSEGVDLPELRALIMASGGKSETNQIQTIGRALRTTKDKKTALIIDVLDNGHFLRDHAQGRVMLYKETF